MSLSFGLGLSWKYLTLLLLGLGVTLPRLATIDYDVFNVDEAVYLLIGRAWRLGEIPYVDIVDRKPLGLFFISGLADALFWNPIVGARILGLGATLATAWMLVRFAQRYMQLSAPCAAVVGLLYATYVLLFGGDTVEAPTYYAPFLVGAAYLVAIEIENMHVRMSPSIGRAAVIGLLLGVTFQIKYVTGMEAVAFALAYLFAGWRWGVNATAKAHVILALAVMTAVSLLPLALSYAVYAAMGYGEEFLFYVFTSNFIREVNDASTWVLFRRVALLTAGMLPLLILSGLFIRRHFKTRADSSAPKGWVIGLLVAWAVAALASAIGQMQFYDNNFYPMVMPLALLAGAALATHAAANQKRYWTAVCIVIGFAGAGYTYIRVKDVVHNGSPYQPSRIAADVVASRAKSLYVFNYHTLLYATTDLALPTKFPLASHLTRDLEARSFQVDAVAEVQRILDGNPEAMVVSKPWKDIPPDRLVLVQKKLADDYCLWRTYEAGRDNVEIFVNRSAKTPAATEACANPFVPNLIVGPSPFSYMAELRDLLRQREEGVKQVVQGDFDTI